jgi:hypothetical protein
VKYRIEFLIDADGDEMKVRAKNDVRILMEDGRYSNFIKGNEYRCMFREESVILIDEDRMGFSCDMKELEEDFELIDESK